VLVEIATCPAAPNSTWNAADVVVAPEACAESRLPASLLVNAGGGQLTPCARAGTQAGASGYGGWKLQAF